MRVPHDVKRHWLRMPHGWSHKDKSPSVPAGLAMGEGMTRYAIAPPKVGARFIVKQPIWKPGALTRGFRTARGYLGNRRRWRDRPATMRTSCLRGFRKRKITAWSLKHLRRGAVVDSDGMAYFRAAAKAGYAYPDTDRGDNTLLRNLALPLDNTCHGWGTLYVLLYHPECSDRVSLGYRFAAMVPRLAYVALRTPPLSHFPVTLAKTHSQAGRPYREASELLQGQNTQNN